MNSKLLLQNMTMYRLMMYFMVVLLSCTTLASFLGILPYNSWAIIWQAMIFVGICWTSNTLIARALHIQVNSESSVITGLILCLLAGPLVLPGQWYVAGCMAITAMASKYLFVLHKSHIFNPAAFGVLVSALFLGYPASWWIGSAAMAPIIVIGGVLIMQKIRRWHLVTAFFVAYFGLFFIDTVLVQGRSIENALGSLFTVLTNSPILFFAFVMLIEPLTSPQTTTRRIWFGVFVGVVLFSLHRFFSGMPYSLELSLVIGNIFARWSNPDFRQAFVLRKKEIIHSAIGHFYFEPARAFPFLAGQFLEYTMPHQPDSRGVRRYFTIASSPTEKAILLSTKFSYSSSSFKDALKNMEEGQEIIASKVAGDFVLPRDPSKKLAFIAGGIGITPFRSMVKYLLDTDESRDIVLLYAVRAEKDIVFRDIFTAAYTKFGMKTAYSISEPIDEQTIRKEIPDYADRFLYISGPEPMVKGVSNILVSMNVRRTRIFRDFFPGYQDETRFKD